MCNMFSWCYIHYICDWICEKGSYSLPNSWVWLIMTSTGLDMSSSNVLCPEYSNWISGWYLHHNGRPLEIIGCQVHAIGKAIRPLFADLVTYVDYLHCYNYVYNCDFLHVVLLMWTVSMKLPLSVTHAGQVWVAIYFTAKQITMRVLIVPVMRLMLVIYSQQ